MRNPGRSAKELSKCADELSSGKWLRDRQTQIVKLTRGLKAELGRFPKPAQTRFITRIVTSVCLGEAVNSVFSEKARANDIEEMIHSCKRFIEENSRANVLARALPAYSAAAFTSRHTEEEVDALVADTLALREARKKAFAAVRSYIEELNAALHTVRRRKPGEKSTADESGFFGALARRYQEDLVEAPTQTPGGTFSNVVTLIREYQGKPCEDVSRIVRAALKRL